MANQYYKKGAAPTKEAKQYAEATGLLEAVECVTRFEWEVKALEDAAAIFEELGEYKDAADQAKLCRKQAEEAREKGYETVFRQTTKALEQASTKSDYADAITNLKRVTASRKHGGQAEEKIAYCQKRILRLETIAVWKRRGILLAVLLVLAFLYYRSPAFPFTKGYLLQRQGKYQEAIAQYRQASGFPLTKRSMEACHLAIGENYLKHKQRKLALRELRKAEDNQTAQKLVAKLEKRRLRKTEVGKTVHFGKKHWIVLRKDTDHVLLLYREREQNPVIYQKGENQGFCRSYLGRWLNTTFKEQVFSGAERKLLEEIDQEEGQEKEGEENISFQISLLTKGEFEAYHSLIQPVTQKFWLKEERMNGKQVIYADESGVIRETDGTKAVCVKNPVVYVRIR